MFPTEINGRTLKRYAVQWPWLDGAKVWFRKTWDRKWFKVTVKCDDWTGTRRLFIDPDRDIFESDFQNVMSALSKEYRVATSPRKAIIGNDGRLTWIGAREVERRHRAGISLTHLD